MGNDLGCSAVVLSFRSNRTLPNTGTSTLARVDIAAVVPECGGSVTLHYVDEGGCFRGVASTNVITINGQSVTFTNGQLTQDPLVVDLVSTTPCNPATLVQDLIDDVKGLTAAAGIKTALNAILSAALGILSDGNTHNDASAVPMLNAFITLVTQQSGKGILPADAARLIASANEIIAILTSSA